MNESCLATLAQYEDHVSHVSYYVSYTSHTSRVSRREWVTSHIRDESSHSATLTQYECQGFVARVMPVAFGARQMHTTFMTHIWTTLRWYGVATRLDASSKYRFLFQYIVSFIGLFCGENPIILNVTLITEPMFEKSHIWASYATLLIESRRNHLIIMCVYIYIYIYICIDWYIIAYPLQISPQVHFSSLSLQWFPWVL